MPGSRLIWTAVAKPPVPRGLEPPVGKCPTVFNLLAGWEAGIPTPIGRSRVLIRHPSPVTWPSKWLILQQRTTATALTLHRLHAPVSQSLGPHLTNADTCCMILVSGSWLRPWGDVLEPSCSVWTLWDRRGGSLSGSAVEGPTDSGNSSGLRWFALRVKSHCEKVAAASLRSRDYAEFLPLYRSRWRWSDRWVELERPLFPGYVFCRFDPDHRLPILTIPSLVHIVGIGRVPLPVEDSEIAAVQSVVRSGLAAQPWPYIRVGDVVRVRYGVLRDLEGILIEVKKRHRLVVSIALLQRSVAVEIGRDWVSLVRPASRGPATAAVRRPVSLAATAAGLR